MIALSETEVAPITFTRHGVWRGARQTVPMILSIIPFGIVTGITAQGVGLSWAEIGLMSAFVYAGASQLVALSIWTHPPDLLALTLAAFVVNLRLALMGPVLSPWLHPLRGLRVWGSLFVMADQNWALAVKEMNLGGRDAGFLLGSGLTLWAAWTVTTILGQLLGAEVRPAPGHPLFFAALGVFVCMLVGMWRGRLDLMPWVVAGFVSVGVAQLLPGTFWYIVAGAVSGSIVGGLRDQRRAERAA